MRMTLRLGLAVAMLAVAGPALAQAGPQGRGMGPMPMMQRTPVDIILEHHEQLRLTEEQVATLKSIDERVTEENRPHVEKVRELMGDAPTARGGMQNMTPQQRQAMRQRREAARPAMEAIQQNNEKGLKEAEEILTEEQRNEARDLIRQVRERRPRPGGAPRPG